MTAPDAVGRHAATPPDGAGPDEVSVVLLHGGNVASWMWEPQVEHLADLDVRTPDLPGFGSRAAEDVVSLDATADDVAALVAALPAGRAVHLVGLSYGGIVALRVAARHPGLVRSVLASGAAVDGVPGLAGAVGRAQLRVWDRRWYWEAQARAFRLPADARDLFVRSGLAIRRDNMARTLRDVYGGCWPTGLEASGARVLAVAGSRDLRAARSALGTIARRVPDAVVRLAPGMHHQWSAEDPDLFSATIHSWVVDGVAHPRLVPPAGRA
ncbi:alpha/beta hydrolase [Cellulosimicrobium cellulans]|uniref:alpha/beta fold hydrolase n=1 Tax=Cellulosimicrobium cellulans TaxID=1710 RepID=UPI00214A2A3D|nr:alpha/beta hydrolase [Cellulosimicrobium cellulans]